MAGHIFLHEAIKHIGGHHHETKDDYLILQRNPLQPGWRICAFPSLNLHVKYDNHILHTQGVLSTTKI